MKHWILPALCALGLHAVLFNLDLKWTRPAFSVTESRAVTISLVEVARKSDGQKPVASIAPARAEPIKPLTALQPQASPSRKSDPPTAPRPPPSESMDQGPSKPEGDSSEQFTPLSDSETASDSATSGEDTREEKPAFAPQQAEVQASVPLYALNPPPTYPPVARRRNYQGTVVLDVLVDRQGRAGQIKLARSSGYTVLDQSALESVSGWRFEPARRFGQPIEMWVQVPVRFALE